MSQQQIQTFKLLSYGLDELRNEIYKEVNENPALVITKDTIEQNSFSKKPSKGPSDYTRTSTSTSQSSSIASDNFQAALESHADERETLQDHLLTQYNMLRLKPEEYELGRKLIHNLNDKGFYTLAPVSLLDRTKPNQTEDFLESCITKIRHLDPVGTCCKNTEESLYVQALMKPNAPTLAVFILDGHLSFLDPPQSAKVVKKIEDYIAEQSKLFAVNSENQFDNIEVTEEKVDEAIRFIKTLEPFPAHNFGSTENSYVTPDVYIEKVETSADSDNFAKGIVTDGKNTWHIRLANEAIPQLQVSPQFIELASKQSKSPSKENTSENKPLSLSSDEKKLVSGSVKKAQDFLESLSFRSNTILEACCIIVKQQHEFFEKGPGSLVPLKQQDVANDLNVHETTISRMANSKFIQCDWGLFEIKYFFTNAASSKSSSVDENGNGISASKEKVVFEIKKILEEHKNDSKKLSDQKLTDILEERGMSVARRTVAKYRSQLNIASSFDR